MRCVSPEPLICVLLTLRLGHWAPQAVAAWHTAGYLHLDIKPDNVGIDKDGNVRLLDADHSRRVEEAGKHPFAGTRDYAAPELTDKDLPITPAVDVYSVGMTIQLEASTRGSERTLHSMTTLSMR